MNGIGRRQRLAAAVAAALLPLLGSGCTGLRAVNRPLEQVVADRGYRPSIASRQRESDRLRLTLAFSGGGTRAAALAYGVLEALRDTEVVVGGERKRLLDEVDAVSGVSGGSFPAAYYGLFGDRVFDEFEGRFLKRNIQRALILQVLRPRNLLRLFTPLTSRSQLASQYYDANVFDHATFADLAAVKGPRVYINATDLSRGNRFTFTQGQFDLICSDLDLLPIATAVAASSAVPGVLSPITLRNRAGSCGFELPAWYPEALASRRTDLRRYRAALAVQEYLNARARPYIHLVDGGISDNLGLRASLESASLVGGYENLRQLFGVGIPDRLVLVVVNAETDPDPAIDLSASAPSIMALLNSVSGAQIRRYNFETLLLARESLRRAAAEISRPGHTVKPYFIEVSFDAIENEAERRYFKRLPTSFALRDEEVDRLREVGRRLLETSPAFQALVRELR
jgi:NTE family protein